MSLISQEQKKNAGVKEPTIKPPKVAPTSPVDGLTPDILNNSPINAEAAEQQAAFSAVPQQVLAEQALPAVPETPQPPNIQEQVPEQPLDLMPVAPVEIQRAPEKAILPTTPLWQDTTEQLGLGAQLKPEVANTTLPSFSTQFADNSGILNQAFYSNNRAGNAFNEKARLEYAEAQKAQAQLEQRGALPNTPDATKKWNSAPLGFLSDVLFGTERARKLSEAGIPDAGAGSFGRAGAGVGGQINYLLGVIPSAFVGAVGEVNKATANTLQRLGVDKNTAEGFARNGFLQFLPDTQIGESFKQTYREATKNVPVIGGSISKLFDGEAGFKPSQILNFNFDEANKRNLLVDAIAGDPLTDVNEPDGSVKYGRIYTRSQRKEGSSSTDDPVGFALQLGTYLLSPGEIPGDKLTSFAVGKLWNTFRKPAAAAAEAVGRVVTNAPALPSSAMRAEQQLAQRANEARTAQAGQQLFNPPQTPNANPGFDLGAISEEQARRLNTGTPRLGAAEEGGAIEFTAPNANLQEPRLDVGEAYLEYPTNPQLPAGANPSRVPRAYIGSNEVTNAALPPAFNPSEVPKKVESYLLPYSTPGKTALDLGVGNLDIRLEKPGALAVRPLEEVISAVREVEPKLLEGFDGITWEEFKAHLSTQVEDIGQFSNIGEDLSKPGALTRRFQTIDKAAQEQKDALRQAANISKDPNANLTQKFSEIDAKTQAEKQALKESLNTPTGQVAAVEDVVLEASKRQAITAERIKKVRGIRKRVESNSLSAIENLDNAQQAKTSVSEQIKRYESLADEAVNQTIRPMLEESKRLTEEAAQELREMAKNGATEEQISRGLDSLERHNAGVEAEANRILDMVNTLKSQAENLKGNEYFIAEARYNQALADLKNTRKNNSILTGNYRVLDDAVDNNVSLFKPTEDDLLTAAEELAQHKLALEKPMQQLEQVFDETVDFGRKTVDEIPYEVLDGKAALKTTENGGVLKLHPDSFLDGSKEGLRVKNAWLHADYDFLTSYLKKRGFTFEEALETVVNNSNTYISQANKVSTFNLPTPEALTSVTEKLYHGTALDGWTPPDNLFVNGSRGELGHGTYYTTDKLNATDYAQARVGENVSPKTMDFDVNPTVAEVQPKFTATLDARKPLDKGVLKEAFTDLPEPIYKKFSAAVNRKKKPLSYVDMRSIMENSIVKAGVEPTEQLLQKIDADISKRLRGLGYDSIADNQSKFVLSLDNSRVGLVNLENIQQPSVIESATARLNADTHAAKNYDGYLTSDANFRDSTYKVLAQTREAVDQKLAQVQDEIIKRGLPERDSLLPKLPDTSNRPNSFIEATDELLPDDICSI